MISVLVAMISAAALAIPALLDAAAALGSGPAWAPPTTPTTTAPLNECPNVHDATAGCDILIILGVNTNGTPKVTIVNGYSHNTPYDGNDDTTVGVLNQTGVTISSIALSSSLNIFGFDGDGVCSNSGSHTFGLDWSVTNQTSANYTNRTGAVSNSCAYGSTGYEGPNTSFSNIASNKESGTVNFSSSLTNGGSSFFSLENVLNSANFTVPTLSTFTTAPSKSSISYGSSITDKATLSGSTGTPSTPAGTVSFYWCGPGASSCTSTANQVGSAVTVSGSGGTATATSSPFTPKSVGTYCFYAYYSGTNYLSQAETNGSSECFTVTQAPLTITASSPAMTFGGSVPSITPGYSGFVNGDTAASLTTPPSCMTTATSSSPVGAYGTSCSGAVDPNYSISYVPGTLTVNKAGTLTITASSGTMTYGGTPPTITPTFSGVVDGDTSTSLLSATTQPTCSTTATSSSPVGSYPSSCTGAVDPNYSSIVYVSGTVAVNPAGTLTITASSGSMTYGGAPPTIAPTFSGVADGDTSNTLGSATTQPTCSTTATSSSAVGSYPSSCSGAVDPNYSSIHYVNGTVAVNPASLTVTAPSPTITFGSAVPTLTPGYSGFVKGDNSSSLSTKPSCSTSATSSSPVGTYPVTCSGAVDGNYTISYTAGTLTVTPAGSLTITASSPTMTYGGTLPAITPTFSGVVGPDTATTLASATTQPVCTTTAVGSSPVGSYSTSCSGAVDPNYSVIHYAGGTLTIDPAPLQITAPNTSMTFGSTVPTLTPSYSGFVNGDSASSLTTPPVCTTTATSSSPVATYPVTCSGAVDPNYTMSYVPGTLVVNKAGTLTITASSGTMTYGGTPPAVTPSFAGVMDGDTSTSLGSATTPPTCTTTATTTSSAGTYTTSCSGAVDPDYTSIVYLPGTLTVIPVSLTVTASSGTMTSGGSVPTITPTYSGFVNGDGPSNLTTAPICTASATTSSGPGTYATTCSGGVDPDYTFVYVSGTLTVAAAPATAPAVSQTPIASATVVHTGKPWAGARAVELLVAGLGFVFIATGELTRRRRHRRWTTPDGERD